jgi:hypothetical protein
VDTKSYFESINAELTALKDRIRFFIDDKHWVTDGEWKENVLRSLLKRHLPFTIGVGRGFVVAPNRVSTQIDILLYDKTKPILFQNDDLVIVTPDVAIGAIEVKTKVRGADAIKIFTKLADNIDIINSVKSQSLKFFGLFSYEDQTKKINVDKILSSIRQAVRGSENRIINCVSMGESHFIRFWKISPNDRKTKLMKWYSYKLDVKAQAYFIHNVIEHLSLDWSDVNDRIWYPVEGKEIHKTGETEL